MGHYVQRRVIVEELPEAPVVVASYLLANYGYNKVMYNKVMKLAGGSIEKGKENLAKFFIKHDKDITQEQASYLANVAMKVLQTAGQIAVHQVAATKFNAVRKGSQLKTRQGGIGKKGGAGGSGENKVPVGRRGNPIDVVVVNSPATINGRKFTGHALDRMQGRGFTPTIVEDIIQHPTKTIPGKTSGTTVYIGEQLKVVLNKTGDVITIIPQ